MKINPPPLLLTNVALVATLNLALVAGAVLGVPPAAAGEGAGPRNLLSGVTGTVPASYADSAELEALTDSNPGTGWAPSAPATALFELGSAQVVRTVVVAADGSLPDDAVSLSGSADCLAFQPISGQVVGDTATFGVAGTAALRCLLLGVASGSPTITSVSAFAPPSYNAALGRPVTVSGSLGGTNGSEMTDGDESNTRWESNGADNAWAYIDLGDALEIGKVRLKWQTAFSLEYAIQVADSLGGPWTSVHDETGGHEGWNEHSFAPVRARYVKWQGIRRGTQWANSIWEFEVYTASDDSVDLLAGGQPRLQTAPAQSVTAATDSDVYTGIDLGTVVYDLGEAVTVSEVVLHWETKADELSYLLAASPDLDAWEPLRDVADSSAGRETVTFAPLVARYLKLEVRSEAPALVEIAARNANLALEAATRASTDVGGESLATLATDGDLGSRWASRQSDPQWIYVSFGEARPVNAVRLYWEGAYASSYRVEISDDALNWTPVFVEPNGDGGVDSITFPVQEAAYVRVFGVSRATTYGYSIWEFEVYGPPGVAVTAAVDTDALVAELEAAEGFAEAAHTASSWRTFESARATAQGLAEDPYVNQRTVDTATTELTEARESLVERGDPAQLQAVADAFAEVDFTQSYTAETVLALDAALLAAQGKLAPEAAADTVQADFDTAVAAVWKAYAALVAKPVQTPEVTRPVVVVPRPAPAKTDPTPPPTPAKAKPTVVAKLVAKKVKASKRAKVKVTVSAKGVKSPSGNLVVKVGKKSVKAKVSKGKATVTLPKLKRGKYTVKVQYLGSSAIAKKTVTVAAKLRIV